MDRLADNVSIYDLFGIWCPGAVSITYYISVYTVINWNEGSLNKLSSLPYIIWILMYTALAFFLGIVLHEIGKVIVGFFGDMFSVKKEDDVSPSPISKMEIKTVLSSVLNSLFPFKKIRTEFKEQVNAQEEITLDYVISYFKFTNNSKLIDRYHSFYGLNRGIFSGLVLHLIFILIRMIMKQQADYIVVILDVVLSYLFFCRTYCCYIRWVKNTFQLYNHIKRSEEN